MFIKGRVWRWFVTVGGAAILLQAGACQLSNPQVAAQVREQLVIPALSGLVSDVIFFTLDTTLVHLTT